MSGGGAMTRPVGFLLALLLALAPAAARAAEPDAALLAVAQPRGAAAVAPVRRDTLRLTLDEALARAQESGEEMRLARARVQEAAGQVTSARSAALPQLSGVVTYNRRIESIFTSLESGPDSMGIGKLFANSPFGAQNSWNVNLTASQLLYSGGKVGAALKAAHAYRKGALAQEREAAGDVAYSVRKAYYDAVFAGRVVAIAEAGLQQARDLLREVTLYRREGSRSEYDMLRAQVDAANQEPPVVAARNGYTLALLELKRLVNLPLEEEVALATPLVAEDGTVPVTENVSLDPAARPALTAVEAAVEVQKQRVRVAKGGRWPDLVAASTLSQQAYPPHELPKHLNEFRRDWQASLQLTFPLFLGGRTFGDVQQARAGFAMATAERDRTRESVAIEVEQARAEMERTRSLLAARRETVRQATRAHELAGVRYHNGMATQLEVSDARLQMQTAEVNEVQAARDYLVALAALERALGRPLTTVRKPLDELTWNTLEEGMKP